MTEKPLHVRVAEALGCRPWQATPGDGPWRCGCPQAHDALNFVPHGIADLPYVKRYDRDWSATGPLIEKYGIGVDNVEDGRWVATDDLPYLVCDEDSLLIDGYPIHFEYGPTPLIAVCNLILSLKEAGKL